MKNPHAFLILIFCVIITAQNSSLKITPKYKHLKLLGKWTFETMQTTTHAEEKEVSITDKDLDPDSLSQVEETFISAGLL